ncbi:MAG: TRAP transporter large permease [Muricauda sp.]|uniref:TRAP dicarboxylate transporter, DctM subunit n=1 Tax=Flagellimonas lutaonensis TaxID=516051 RepID=A0A0D5YRP5_9FLAO|nr:MULTISPECIES: TRAP transporter large permease [Allomuricauda]AKA34574.1 TRAP dicarboxylate transporter, DctM subunit [Allomuricauda lutaonensis]MBC30582.1 TRAP transporter large permease [Allomuricauda sp.]|tara:strand:- start:17199 stop:18494 length:1296 start_codon:yes stop_codon:yes gene_type:complete
MEYIPILVLIISFVGLLSIGTPVAWSIAISSLLTMLVSIPALPAFTTISQRMATGLDSFALLAIPFFILSGELMNNGGIAHRLIAFAKTLVGALPGGLALINVISAMLMGAIAGSAMASASAMGSILGPEMEKEGYDKEFGAAVNITSATTGLVIPPSNILIVYSLASGGASIAALFLAGYIPGILTGLFLMVVASFWAKKKGYNVGKRSSFKEVFRTFVDAVPALFLLVLVIGGIVAGIFTATEASAIAVLYSLILGFIYKEITLEKLPKIFLDSSATTAIVMLLIGASMSMSWVLSYEHIPQEISTGLLGISDNKIMILLIINLILLLVGIFMDITPAVLIFTPIFLPVVTKLGIDPVHFGVIMILNLCIGLCTPPVGSVLFVGVGIAKTSIEKVVRPLLPLFVAMIAALFLITYIPQLTLWLPGLFDL